MKIMVIETDRQYAFDYRPLLVPAGFQVLYNRVGENIIKSIKSIQPDAILIDDDQSGSPGLDILRIIRTELKCEIPIILLTENSAEKLALDFFRSGGVDFLTKPIREPDLLVTKIKLSIEKFARIQQEGRHREELYRRRILTSLEHEFRTPITVLKLQLDKLKRFNDSNLNQDFNETLSRSIETVEKLDTMVESVSALIEILNSDEAVDYMKVNINQALLDTINENGLLYLLKDKRLYFENLLDSDTPEVVGNYIYIKDIFKRMIENAIKFTKKGGVVVDAIWDENTVTILINDTGIGVKPELSDKIFDMFEKQDETGQYPGAGLGLHIVKKLIEQIGGKVSLELSKENCCAAFRISLIRWKNNMDLNKLDPIYLNHNYSIERPSALHPAASSTYPEESAL